MKTCMTNPAVTPVPSRTFRACVWRMFALLATLLPLLAPVQAQRQQPVHLIVGVDASMGARKHLGEYLRVVLRCNAQLRPGVDRLTVYRLDFEATEVLDQVATGSAAALTQNLFREFKAVPVLEGTLPALFWKKTSDLLSTSKGSAKRVRILLLSDGNDEAHATTKKASAQAITRISKTRGVTVCVAGVERQNRERLRQQLKPLGHHALSFVTVSDLGSVTASLVLEEKPKGN